MNLNIGSSNVSGEYKKSNWINLDRTKSKGVNTIADALDLPFAEDSFNEIHCFHVLEHVTRDKYLKMLEELFRVLSIGGKLYLEVPDFEGVVKKLKNAFDNKNDREIHIWTTSTYGKNERPGMAHYWGFHERLLTNSFEAVGFQNVRRLKDSELLAASHIKQEPVLCIVGEKLY